MKAMFILVTSFGLLLAGVAKAVTCANNFPASNPDGFYRDNGDDTVTDIRTSLTWKRCSEGQTWSGGECSGDAAAYTWAQALTVTANSTDAGHDDWRLPNIKELQSLLETCRDYPSINDVVFPNTPTNYSFWSGSSSAYDSRRAWGVNFGRGHTNGSLRDGGYNVHVRLVRGGQSFDNLGVAGLAAVGFVSENLPDGTYLLGTATKTWTFINGAAAISGLKAVQVSGKTSSGLGITATEIAVGDVAANANFTVSLPIAPEHAGAAVKSSYWKLVDGSGANVAISNSRTGQFWLKLRTNTPPAFSPLQLNSAGARVGETVTMPLMVNDAEGDTVTWTPPPGVGSVANSVWSGSFSTPGLKQITVTASDGIDSVSTNLQVMVRDESGMSSSFADVKTGPDSGVCLASGELYNSAYYAEIEYLALHGIIIGTAGADVRNFEPCRNVTQAEALKMLMLAAKEEGRISFDEPPRVLSNLVVSDPANGTFINASWAMPYVLKAETLGIIPDASSFNPQASVTRAWLARAVTRLQALEVPTDAFADTATAYQFPDQASFASTTDYDDALAAAFFGYMGTLAQSFNPDDLVIRADVARVASRILRTPSAEDIVLDGTTQQTVNGLNLPSVMQGGALAVRDVVNLQSPAMLVTGDTVKDEWIDGPEHYVDATAVRLGQGIVPNGSQILVKDLPGAPVAINTTTPDLSHDEIRTLLVILRDRRSGVLSVLRKDYAVRFPDRDSDRVRDDLDVWPDDARFAADANGNGIPDNADSAFGLTNRLGSDAILVDGVQTTIIQALLDSRFSGLVTTLSNHAPVAVDDSLSLAFNTAGSLDPRANDSDSDGDTLSLVAVTQPSHGTVSFTATGATYTPTTGYSGADRFDYTVSDGKGGTAVAGVTVIVAGNNSGGGSGGSGAITANLVTGWNLLGNGTSAAITVATPFGDADKITSVWKWLPADGGQWAFYTPTMTDGGAVYAAGKGYAYLSSIGSGEGFWVNAKAPFTASLGSASLLAASAFRDGSGTGEANILPSGWSLIAVGDGSTPRGFANSIQSPYAPPPAPGTPAATTLTSLWAWYPGDATHAAGWYFYAPTLDNSGGLANYITGKGYLDFDAAGKTLDPTTGFWVNRP